ncbi:MAG: GxxExxY protein [Pseudomonadota bacterium]
MAVDLLHEEETFRIRGALIEVSNAMGHGFLEAVYQECVGLEFSLRGISFDAMPRLRLQYKGAMLTQTYAPDFVCFSKVIVELKVVREFAPEHRAQLCNYLKATGLRVGLLANFGSAGRVVIERIVM